jgi:hypothetical protein
MKKRISFREQYLKCINDKTLFHEPCVCCGSNIFMCRKFGGQCFSRKCLKDRKGDY